MISEVGEDTLEHCFNVLSREISRALKHGLGDCSTLESLYQELVSKKAFMWVVHEGENIRAGVILSIQIFPNKKTLYVEILAGRDMDSWLPELEQKLIEYKQIIGANTIEASCRAGLARRLKHWKLKAISMELI